MAEHDSIDGKQSHKDLCDRWRDVESYNIPSMDELVSIRDAAPDLRLTMLTSTLPHCLIYKAIVILHSILDLT